MRTRLLFAAAATLLSLNAHAYEPGAERVSVVASQLNAAPVDAFAFARLQGAYRLDDGRLLSVTGKRSGGARTLYADLGAGPVELAHVGGNRFVGVGSDVRISFGKDTHREYDPVSVDVPAVQALATR